MSNVRIKITTPDGGTVRTTRSRRYYVVCDPPYGAAFVVMRTDNPDVARRTARGYPYRHLYDSVTSTFISEA